MPHLAPMITLARGRFGATASQVLEQVRAAGPVVRDEVAAATGLSAATVGRAVTALVGAGLLRERPDRIRPGVVGRPGVPVEIDPDRFVVMGVHLGRRIATVALADLAGRVRCSETVRREAGAPPDLEGLARAASRLLGTLPAAAPLAAGLVAPWRDLGLDPDTCGEQLHEITGLDVSVGDHIAAVAASEFLHRRHGTPGVTLYVYARDTIGFAVAVDKGELVEVSRVSSLTHFPAGGAGRCECGRTGCLRGVAGDEAVVRAVRDLGLPVAEIEDVYAAVHEPAVLELLRARARLLGAAAGVVRDMTAPDRVVLVGQAYTGCSAVLGDARAALDAGALAGVPVSFTRFGADIQAIAASTVALGPVYDDPLGLAPAGSGSIGESI